MASSNSWLWIGGGRASHIYVYRGVVRQSEEHVAAGPGQDRRGGAWASLTWSGQLGDCGDQ